MALTASDIKVTGLNEEATGDLNGTTRIDVRVYYMIGEFGPYSIVVPKLEMTAQRVLQEVRQDSLRYLDVLNLTF